MDAVHEWVVSRGGADQCGPRPSPFSAISGFADVLAGLIAHGGFTVAERDDRLVGVLAMADAPPDEVPADRLPAGAAFVHFVMSDRGAAGRGVGRLLLAEAKRRASHLSAPAVALGTGRVALPCQRYARPMATAWSGITTATGRGRLFRPRCVCLS